MEFGVFALWVAAVVVASVIGSMMTGGPPFPGVWGPETDEERHRPGPTHRPALAGRSP